MGMFAGFAASFYVSFSPIHLWWPSLLLKTCWEEWHFFFFFFRFKLSRKKIMLKKGSVKSKRQMYLLENPFSDQAILSLKPSGLSTSHSPANKCQTPWFGSQRPCPSGLRWFFGLCFLMPRFCVLFCNKIRLFIFLEEPSFPLFAHLCLFYPKRFFFLFSFA